MPANKPKPVLLVDVDGVISLFGFEPDSRPAGRYFSVDGIAHYLSATAGRHLRDLAPHFELVWCSGWEDRANVYLPYALELADPLPHLTFAGPPGEADRHWKLDAIDAYAGPTRPLAWIDDDHSNCETWAQQRPGPTLLIATDPQKGITEEHFDQLLRWAESLPDE
ncbi:MAG: hypothetical protein QOK04_1337 [Solirubrobacteraceae bacterium]|nr:hypothetical protein [Solirubrobacteraceae bacterium]